MNKCRDCLFFERKNWHKVVDSKCSPQSGGDCELLAKVLSMDNYSVRQQDSLYVYEEFGCSLFKEKV